MNRTRNFFSLILIIATFTSCAKVGSPYGGPKDEDPPVVLKTKPLNGSVNFIPQKKVVIYFDEFIQLDDIFTEMMLSPPMEEKLVAQVKGRSLTVTFPDEAVFDSTTYTLSFGTGIVDNNERNVLENYTYIFSFKDFIDSLHVEGKIKSAYNFLPDEERMFVMLYKNLNDSAPLLEVPNYIAKTNKDGVFHLPNLEAGKYRIFGLKDANGNLLFDLPSEQIAFSDSIIELTPERFIQDAVIGDSLLKNTLARNDSLSDVLPPDENNRIAANNLLVDNQLDSALVLSADDSISLDSSEFKPDYFAYHIDLLFFTETSYSQYMTNYLRPRKEKLFFSFNESPHDTIEIHPLNYTFTNPNWFLLDKNSEGDTLNLWLTDTAMVGMDSLFMEVCYPMYDSAGMVYNQVDTLLLRAPVEKVTEKKGRGGLFKSEEEEPVEVVKPKLKVGNNIKNVREFALNKNVELIIPTPIASAIGDSIRFYQLKDTLQVPVDYKLLIDSSALHTLTLEYEPESESRYRIFIPDSIIYDIYGETHDTLDFTFKTRAADTYGIVSMNISNVKQSMVIQLLGAKEKILQQQFIHEDQKVRFEFLDAGEYTIKVYYDDNSNTKWDTGNYLEHKQPERVLYYPEKVSVRANWEHEKNWVLAD